MIALLFAKIAITTGVLAWVVDAAFPSRFRGGDRSEWAEGRMAGLLAGLVLATIMCGLAAVWMFTP